MLLLRISIVCHAQETTEQTINSGNGMRFVFFLAACFMFAANSSAAITEAEFYEWKITDLLKDVRFSSTSNDLTVSLIHANGKWVIDDVSKSGNIRPDTSQKPEYITICQSCNPGKIVVIAEPMEPSSPDACSKGVLNGLAKSRSQYNVCSSQFYNCGTSVGQAVLGWQLLILGTRLCNASLNVETVAKALKEANVYPWFIQRNEELKREEMQSSFNKIKTSEDAKAFIGRYSSEENGLVPLAEEKLGKLKEKEESDNIRLAQEREAAEAANIIKIREAQTRAREAERFRLEEIERQKKAIQLFRLDPKPGDESHCGMVIETKGSLIKVQTMVGEKWFRRNQIYPAGLVGCRFVNNVYQDYVGEYFVK